MQTFSDFILQPASGQAPRGRKTGGKRWTTDVARFALLDLGGYMWQGERVPAQFVPFSGPVRVREEHMQFLEKHEQALDRSCVALTSLCWANGARSYSLPAYGTVATTQRWLVRFARNHSLRIFVYGIDKTVWIANPNDGAGGGGSEHTAVHALLLPRSDPRELHLLPLKEGPVDRHAYDRLGNFADFYATTGEREVENESSGVNEGHTAQDENTAGALVVYQPGGVIVPPAPILPQHEDEPDEWDVVSEIERDDCDFLPAYVKYARHYIQKWRGFVPFVRVRLGQSGHGVFRKVTNDVLSLRRDRVTNACVDVFSAGDTFTYHGHHYVVTPLTNSLLWVHEVPQVLIETTLESASRMIFDWGAFRHYASADRTGLTREALHAMDAFSLLHAQQTPHAIASAQILNREAFRSGADSVYPLRPAWNAINLSENVRITHQNVQTMRMVGTFYPGLCFDCHAELPRGARGPFGTCGACGEVAAARLVREWRMVCSFSLPICYPGLVVMRTSVAPLKKSSRTWASRKNYRFRGATEEQMYQMAQDPNRKGTFGSVLVGVAINGCYPYTTTACALSLHWAIQFRIYRVVDRQVPEQVVFDLLWRLRDELLGEFMQRTDPWTLDEWLATLKGERKRILMRKNKQRQARPASHFKESKYACIGAFVKREHLPAFGQTPDGPSTEFYQVPRLIQPPSDETHLDAGRFLKPMLGELKGAWSAENFIFYGSVAPEKLDIWLNHIATMRSFFWADYSAFDATYSVEAWNFLEGLYETKLGGRPEELWGALDVWRKPRGKAHSRRDGVQFSWDSPVCNASGRDDTALANALLNGTVLAVSITAALCSKPLEHVTSKDVEQIKRIVRISVVGDDSLVGLGVDVGPYAEQIGANIRRFGLVVKSAWSADIRDVTYLGMLPLPVAQRWWWAPTLGRRLYKAFFKLEEGGNAVAWLRGVAMQLAMYRHVPIMYELSAKILSLTVGAKVTHVQRDEHRVWAARTTQTPPYDDGTVACLARRYNTTPAAIERDLHVVDRIARLPAVVHLDTVVRACMMDDL